MRTLEFRMPLTVREQQVNGSMKERKLRKVTDDIADWSWTPQGCIQVFWWGSSEKKLAGQAVINGGGTAVVDVYVTHANNIHQITMPDFEISGPSVVVRPNIIAGVH